MEGWPGVAQGDKVRGEYEAGREQQEHELWPPGTNSVLRKCKQPCAFGANEHRGVVRNQAQNLARGQFMANFLNNQNKAISLVRLINGVA